MAKSSEGQDLLSSIFFPCVLASTYNICNHMYTYVMKPAVMDLQRRLFIPQRKADLQCLNFSTGPPALSGCAGERVRSRDHLRTCATSGPGVRVKLAPPV